MKLAGALAVSLAVHAAVLAVLALGILPIERWTAEVQPEPITFEVISAVEPEPEPSLIEPEPEPAPPEPEPEPAPSMPEPQVAAARVPNPRIEPSPAPLPHSDEVEGNAAPSASTSTMELPEIRDTTPPRHVDSEEERRRMAALLDPTAVARSGFDFGPGPTQRGAPAGLGSVRDGRRPTEREIEQGLGSSLRAEAMTKNHLTREPFRLTRRPDGTQAWTGPRLTGVIHPDGTVSFEDRPNVQTNGFSASGTFDLTEAVMGASGQDPLRAERDYFMRHTEELRHRLEDEHARQEMAAGLRRLPVRLDRIWGTESRTPEARRRRIFDTWDEIATDADGQRARSIVIDWIRRVLPEGSPDAFTAEEIRRFNATRESEEPFAPY